MKTASTFFAVTVRETVARNIAAGGRAREEQRRLIDEAAPWLGLTEDALWARVFGPTLPRSWMVWSNGHCPACQRPVVMYEWKMDPFAMPWKTACPRCGEIFPKNDFGAYYRSGLDAGGVFNPLKADRSLLFNCEHPGSADPRRGFGVDDGNGYSEGKNKWRFIGAYLIYSEWKKFIVAGIRSLAAAFVVTGDRAYARRALVLLDRVADVFPGFDFATQGEVYEKSGHHGYVSVWHDANMEHTEMVIAYDQVFDALSGDAELVGFLSEKARKHALKNHKRTAEDIRRNIEERLFRDALLHREKIHINFPGMHLLAITMRAILDWPGCRDEIYGYWADVLKRMTCVDGVTGEKGLAAYTRLPLRWLANTALLFILSDPGFLTDMVKRVPSFARSFRFHVDTWCADGRFYPNEGDGTWFGANAPGYLGLANVVNEPGLARMPKNPGARPSMDRMLFEMAKATGDIDLLRVIVRENGGRVSGSVFDLTLADIAGVEAVVQKAIDEHGAELRPGCVDLKRWHLAIIRSGRPGRERAAWLDYDSGGYHSHQDGLNMGLFAHGMDLMPDAGYPPVQFGGWGTDKVSWYYHTAAHNSVVIDGQSQRTDGGRPLAGETRMWTQTPTVKTVKASAPAIYGVAEYERTLVLVDIDENSSYVVDIFRATGGRDHAKFIHSNFSTMATSGLKLKAGEDFGRGTLLRNFRCDPNPAPGWSADWRIEDRFGYLEKPINLHLRYTDFTLGASAAAHEGWYVEGPMSTSVKEQWIPRMMVRRQVRDGGPLTSTFIGVFEPYVGTEKIRAMRRLAPRPEEQGAAEIPTAVLEIELADGRRDVLALGGCCEMTQPKLRVVGYGALVRYDAKGEVIRIATIDAWEVEADDIILNLEAYSAAMEIEIDRGGAKPAVKVVSEDISERYGIQRLTIGGEIISL